MKRIDSEFQKACVEVLTVLKHTEKEVLDRIPQSFLEFLEKNKDKSYEFHAERGKMIAELDLSKKSKVLMAMIYRNYFCTEEERKEYDRLLGYNERKYRQSFQSYILDEIHAFQKSHGFYRMELKELKGYHIGCTETLTVFPKLIRNYVDLVPGEYIKILKLSRKKGYHFSIEWQEGEKLLLHEETLKILSDIEQRYWKGFSVAFDDIWIDEEIEDLDGFK